ncbi:MAG: winged helix-turn-helix domain-containing protein [Nitrososphaerota archaeon]|nr:winged helix-turn-helix domain-containing protein [Nitrososphaerota archaeon]MDG6930434.1 winged helix-turn-helix domain-containing protein [Nitrososphaerota archaeon]
MKDKPRSGRPDEIPTEVVTEITKELSESREGWTTKQVAQLITERSGIVYHINHVSRLKHKWGFRQKVPRKEHVNTASKEEKEEFKKSSRNTGQPPGRLHRSRRRRIVLHI